MVMALHDAAQTTALLEHMDSHLERERKFKCEECGRGYRHAGSLANHRKAHDVGSFRCSVCGKENSNALALKNHMRTHTSQKKYSCLQCGKAFRLATQLSTHERVHLTSQATECENNDGKDVTEVFNTPCDTSGDATSRPFKCNLCDKTYIHHRSLSNHKKTHQVGMFECTVCFKLFNNMAALYNHQRTHKVLFPSHEEFQEHIQMHNSSSSVPFGLQDNTAESHHVTYDDMSKSNCYAPRINNPSLSPVGNSQAFNGRMYSDCSNNQTPQGEPSVTDTNNIIPAPESGSVESEERPFRCQICGKSYRHSGSLINHKRSHQVGTYRCSICKKNYPHLAALKSHLRLHKGQKCSFSLNGEGDWLSLEPFTSDNRQGCFPSQDNDDDDDAGLGVDQENGVTYSERLHQELSEHLMQRHMCADCGETFADIAGIIAHGCPSLRQQQHITGDDRGAGVTFRDGTDASFREENDASRRGYIEQDQLNGEEDDGDLYQCSVCGNGYTSMTALRSHLGGHTQSQSAVAASSGPSSMSSEEEAKDEESEEMMICSTCGESFACRQDLLTHQLVHIKHSEDDDIGKSDEEEVESLICSRCGVFCTNVHHLENHDCTAKRQEEEELKAKDVHRDVKDNIEASVDRQYRCDQCGRSYRHAGSLLNHKKSHKTGVFKCNICQKRFYNLLALKNHQRSHFDVKRHTCHECGKAFKIKKQLFNHLRRHKENRAKIQELNDQVQALMRLNRTELDEDTGEQTRPDTWVKSDDAADPRPFACEECGRTYRHAGSLVNHRNSHKTGRYCCSVCNNAYSNRLALKNHLRTHLADRKHYCQKCGRGFRGQKQLSLHICADSRKSGRRSSRQRASKCKHCKQTFPTGDQLVAHACGRSPGSDNNTQGNVKAERTFSCNICQRSYRHAGSLLNHKNTHKTGHFVCTFCSKPFTNPMALRNHTRIHTQKKKYACVTCGKAFRLASMLHNHQKVHSRVDGHFSCSACGKSFQGRSGLKRHRCRKGEGSSVQQGDNLDKCFTCDLCGRSYRHAGSLLNHKKTHSENLHHCPLCLQTFPDPLTLQIHSQMRRHCCPDCGRTFCLISHLQSHMEAHSKERSRACPAHTVESKPEDLSWDVEDSEEVPPPLSHLPESGAAAKGRKSHVCEHCGRTYRHAGSLLNHKNSHKTGSFSCAVCFKEFTNLMALKNHRRIHTEPKRYQCLECGKAFRVSTQLICHRRIHSKEKPFACLLCDKTFSSKSNLRHHERMHQDQQSYDSASFSWDANNLMGLDMGSFL
uniref:zinc finger protein 646 isoform X2 n=1 Tax=Doryrhamphus excisus TaxID=161450 RepID=UPI0025ADAD7F|nr:zinc finger protein 646 isoform X2 [Doryrhamphus excisus]